METIPLQSLIQLLPNLLSKEENWKTVIFNKYYPHMHRLSLVLNEKDIRCIHLNKTWVCEENQSQFHTHLGEVAVKVLKGKQVMYIAEGEMKAPDDKPEVLLKLKMTPGTSYHMVHPRTLHKIVPVEDSLSVFIEGKRLRKAPSIPFHHNEGEFRAQMSEEYKKSLIKDFLQALKELEDGNI